MNGERVLDISWGTIFKIGISLFSFYFLYLIRDILILTIFALIFSVLFNPAIDFLQRKKIPRVLAIIFVYIGVFGIISFLIYLTAHLFLQEIQQFLQIFPQYFEKISPPLKSLGVEAFESFETLTKTFQDWLLRASSNIFSASVSIFGGIFSTLFIITISIFLSLEENLVERSLIFLFPKKYENFVLDLWKKCQMKVSGWFGTRVIACLFVGVFSYFAFFLFNVKYSFLLSLLAGSLNFIPIIGPILSGILIFLIVSLDSISQAIFALIAFILIQQIEGNILTPILTKKFIDLPPVLVLISLSIGGKLWGILGAILAIPLAGIIFEFLKEFLEKRKREKEVVF
jgi:predicted PurR-regulated permease PerM